MPIRFNGRGTHHDGWNSVKLQTFLDARINEESGNPGA